MNLSLFFLYIFQTVKCYSCQNNDTFEDELKVGINTQNRQGICQGGKDQYTGYNSGDLTDTTGKGYTTNYAAAMASISHPCP